MTRFAVVVEVFGVSEDDVLADEGKGLIENLVHAGEFTGVEEIGRVQGDFEMRRADFIEQAAGFPGGIDHIAHFGFEGKDDVGLAGDAGRLADTSDHVPP